MHYEPHQKWAHEAEQRGNYEYHNVKGGDVGSVPEMVLAKCLGTELQRKSGLAGVAPNENVGRQPQGEEGCNNHALCAPRAHALTLAFLFFGASSLTLSKIV